MKNSPAKVNNSKPVTILELKKEVQVKPDETKSLLIDKEREIKNKLESKKDFLFPLKTLFS